ncbi:HNH endonuclease [Arthrobacter castelli]|uniref:HNH endonuclease n=1 Tax=Arthrobacter castelli TaxID=271431 RepID=UPI0003FECF95|nr:HNH endonuclease signature motif containing protein [Arthrobacter castelli]
MTSPPASNADQAELLDLSVQDLCAWTTRLAGLESASDADTIECIRALEEMKSAAAAAQARMSAVFDVSQRRLQAEHGMPEGYRGKGVGAQLALARRESPSRGARFLKLSTTLVHEMPHSLAAMSAGRISEWRATLLARETECLSKEHRAAVDQELAADAETLSGLSDRRLIGLARRAANRLEPASMAARAVKAANERSVTCRPAPDSMCYLTALVPVAQGVAALAALSRVADGANTGGEERGRGQIMADTLVERITGQETASAVPVQVQLVMTDRTLLAGDSEPAMLPGYGVVSGETARGLTRAAPGDGKTWIRRLYTAPGDGALVAMDSSARAFPAGMARFISTRDQLCSTPWCDAPIRHVDHIVPKAAGGPTSDMNGRGQCAACNYAKEAPGWRVSPDERAGPDGRAAQLRRVLAQPHGTTTTTPTGHTYVHTTLPPPGAPGPRAG